MVSYSFNRQQSSTKEKEKKKKRKRSFPLMLLLKNLLEIETRWDVQKITFSQLSDFKVSFGHICRETESFLCFRLSNEILLCR